MGAMDDLDRPVATPSLRRRLLEMSWPAEAAGFFALSPLLQYRARGDRHPVLVLPGFTAGDVSTAPLRWAIRGQGYQVHAWRQGRNIGPTAAIINGLRGRLADLADLHQAKISIVGWSLGGIYARMLAREQPDLVRQVISLGSPYRMVEGDGSTAMVIWKRLQHLHDADVDIGRIAEQDRPPLRVPATSIYSRRDGVAPWQTCIDQIGSQAENIEVYASHTALGMHPAVSYAVMDRLSQPEDSWQPFHPPTALRLWYPRPVAWSSRRDRQHRASLRLVPTPDTGVGTK